MNATVKANAIAAETARARVAVSLRNVGICYTQRPSVFSWRKQTFWAVKNVSFDLVHGQTTGIVGKNGAGKSSIISAIAGIIKPDQGTIERFGVEIRPLTVKAGLARNLSGRENAILSGMLMGLSRREIIARLPKIIEFAELEDFIDQPLDTYSAGMSARLGFSVAIHVDTDVILIDESLSAGDASFRKKSAQALREIIQSDKTVVLVSHNSSTIRELCNHVVWVEDGVVHQQGDPDSVMDAYEEIYESKKLEQRKKRLNMRRRIKRLRSIVEVAKESGFVPERPNKSKRRQQKEAEQKEAKQNGAEKKEAGKKDSTGPKSGS